MQGGVQFPAIGIDAVQELLFVNVIGGDGIDEISAVDLIVIIHRENIIGYAESEAPQVHAEVFLRERQPGGVVAHCVYAFGGAHHGASQGQGPGIRQRFLGKQNRRPRQRRRQQQ